MKFKHTLLMAALSVFLFSCSAKNTSADIVIIGAGGAGLTAATAAAMRGAKVIVFEKTASVGGNSRFATGGINASETSVQKALGIYDSNDLNHYDTMRGGYNLNDPELVRTLADSSAKTIDWLISIGADLSDVGKMAGTSVRRTHRPKGGSAIGAHLIPILHKAALDAGAEIRLNSRVTDILSEGGKAVGVEVQAGNRKYKLYSKAVIVASGGFSANKQMLEEINERYGDYGTTNLPGTTGDAFEMTKKFNAELYQMEKIQIFPTAAVFNKNLITEAVRGNGAILVNKEGRRFANEMANRDVLSLSVSQQTGGTVYIIFSQNIRESLQAIESYVERGFTVQGNTPEELAEKLKIPANTFKETIDFYNEYVRDENDFEFGREPMDMPRQLDKGPYYAVEVCPAVHFTMGGLKINTKAQVLNTKNRPIPGLYAAGEVTGGVHGGNRIGGNAVAENTIFGKIAAESAIEYIKTNEE